jgi:hypothetical protein
VQRRYEAAGVELFEDPGRPLPLSPARALRRADRDAALAGAAGPGLPPLPRAASPSTRRSGFSPRRASILDERLVTNAGQATARRGNRRAARLKIVSPDIPHKTEMGGVMLDVPAAEAGAV